jgi:hypothetical protein
VFFSHQAGEIPGSKRDIISAKNVVQALDVKGRKQNPGSRIYNNLGRIHFKVFLKLLNFRIDPITGSRVPVQV